MSGVATCTTPSPMSFKVPATSTSLEVSCDIHLSGLASRSADNSESLTCWSGNHDNLQSSEPQLPGDHLQALPCEPESSVTPLSLASKPSGYSTVTTFLDSSEVTTTPHKTTSTHKEHVTPNEWSEEPTPLKMTTSTSTELPEVPATTEGTEEHVTLATEWFGDTTRPPETDPGDSLSTPVLFLSREYNCRSWYQVT